MGPIRLLLQQRFTTCAVGQTTPAVVAVGITAHPGLLLVCVLVEVKVPDPPVAHAGPQLEG